MAYSGEAGGARTTDGSEGALKEQLIVFRPGHFPSRVPIEPLRLRVWIGCKPGTVDTGGFQNVASFAEENGTYSFSFKSGNNKKRPNAAISWISGRKADNFVLLFPRENAGVCDEPFIVNIEDIGRIAKDVFSDGCPNSLKSRDV